MAKSGTRSRSDAAALRKKAHSESRNTAERGERAWKGDTKEAFIRSGFSLAVNGTSGADAAVVGLNSGLIAQGRA